MNFMLFEGGLHMVLGNKPVAIAKSDKHFEAVVQAIKEKKSEAEIQEILDSQLKALTAATQVTDHISIQAGVVLFKDEPLHGTIATRMIQLHEEGFSLSALEAFMLNLEQNPSNRVVTCLYDFLEVGKCPITEDGCFLVYKAVRKDFGSIHATPSGTHLDNSVGNFVEMPRNKVDENMDRTCSYGLHVCSYDYLPHFSHADGHVVVCKVNPRDVVAIPRDYNNTKMRVCRYEVIGVHEGYYKDQGDTLSTSSLKSSDFNEAVFEVQTMFEDGGHSVVGGFDRLMDAAESMEDELQNTSVYGVRLVNRLTNLVLDERINPDYESASDDDVLSEDDDQYKVVGYQELGTVGTTIGTADSIGEALQVALDSHDEYEVIEVVDQHSGEVVRKIA